MNDSEGIWRTVGGRRIFIKNGQNLQQAMINSGKFDKTKILNKLYRNDRLDTIVMQEDVKHNRKRKYLIVHDKNYYYQVEMDKDRNYNIKHVYDIEKSDPKKLLAIEKVINDVKSKRRNNSSYTSWTKLGQLYDKLDNNDFEQPGGVSEYIDTIIEIVKIERNNR